MYLCSLNSSSYFSLILLYFDVDGWVTTWCSNCCGTIIKKLIKNISAIILEFFHDGGPYHIETSTLICKTNQWTGFYMIGTSVVKELNCKKNWVQILLAIGNTHEILWRPLTKKHLPVQKKVWNMFRVDNRYTLMTSFWCLYSVFWCLFLVLLLLTLDR